MNLKRLICYDTLIRELDIEHNPLLEELDTYETLLTNIDITKNPNLKSLSCACNYIASKDDIIGLNEETLDFFDFEPQNNEKPITELFDEKFLAVVREEIKKPNGDIYQSDVDEVKEIEFHGKGVTSLDGLEHFKSLETLNCKTNVVEELHLYSNKMIKEVNCDQNKLEKLDFSGNKNLSTLNAAQNELTDIDLSSNIALTDIDISNNQLTNIDLSSNIALTDIDISNNQLTDIDLSNNIELTDVDVSSNQLTSIDLSSNDKIEELNCKENLLANKYDIVYPNKIDVEDLDGAEVHAFAQISGFTLFFEPQAPGAPGGVRVKDSNFKSLTELDLTLKCAMNSTTSVYLINTIDVSDIDGITSKQLTGEEGLLYAKASDANIINNIIGRCENSNISPSSEVSVARQSEVGIIVDLPSNIDGKYNLFIVQRRTGNDNILSACLFSANLPKPVVKDIKYNNNYDTYGFIDAFKAKKPSIKTHGFSGRQTEFMVTVEIPTGFDMEIENVSLILSRNDTDYHNNYNQIYDEIELNENLGGGVYKGGKVIGYNAGTRDGDMYVKCTYKFKGTTYEKVQIYHKIISYYYDPSGYVYEAVPSNRLSNVKTTLYYMNGNGEEIQWDCDESGQSNPIYTDKNGSYEWFVPLGFWKVKAEKEGYETNCTKWLEVPPPQMNVNFGIYSYEKPSISEMYVYPDVIEINFNKYVYADDVVKPGNIVVYSNGNPVSGEVRLIDAEIDDWGDVYAEVPGEKDNKYVSKIRFLITDSLAIGDNVNVSIDSKVRSYAGVAAGEGCEQNGVVEIRPNKISTTLGDTPSMSAGNKYTIYYKDTSNIAMQITPVEASRGKRLLLTSDAPWTVSVPEYVEINDNGIAVIPLKGELPGTATINMSLENSNLTKAIDVNVVIAK